VQTVRYYEREGLLEAPEREESGYRRYADRHLQRLQFIRHCRALDIPLAEVRQLLDYAQTPRQSFGTGTAWPDLLVAAFMAVLAITGAAYVLRHARQELRAGEA
jgi:DNA-binding transcriptional MerR regulator